jgi:NAD(P)-dependent dehydrogenase (short-subunit alcohol dehydrogenase family)
MDVVRTGRAPEPGGDFIAFDQTSDADIERVATWLEKNKAGLDVLVNNAGASFRGFDASVAQKTLETNFIGMMKLTDRLRPLFREDARSGRTWGARARRGPSRRAQRLRFGWPVCRKAGRTEDFSATRNRSTGDAYWRRNRWPSSTP